MTRLIVRRLYFKRSRFSQISTQPFAITDNLLPLVVKGIGAERGQALAFALETFPANSCVRAMNMLDVHGANTVYGPHSWSGAAWPFQWCIEPMASQPSREDPTILLGVLSAVERDSEITQRSISSELGIALGLANAYVGRCVRKGLIKVRQAPLNRYAYYLTPHGFAEKSRLTAEYLAVSLNFFRDARRQCTLLLSECGGAGHRRLALAGVGEFAEIAILSAAETSVEVVCVVGPGPSGRLCAGLPVLADLARAFAWAEPDGGIDAVIITDVKAPQAIFESVVAEAKSLGLGRDQILAPSFLRISWDQVSSTDLRP